MAVNERDGKGASMSPRQVSHAVFVLAAIGVVVAIVIMIWSPWEDGCPTSTLALKIYFTSFVVMVADIAADKFMDAIEADRRRE